MSAGDHIAAALALVPLLGDHTAIPGSAALEPDLDAAWTLLEQAVTLEPASAQAHALRGNLLLRRGDTLSAYRSYQLAARCDPYAAAARIALGELAYMAGDERESDMWFAEALALTRVFSPALRAGARSALMLCTPGPWPRNSPLDFVVDPARWTLHRWYLPDVGTQRSPLPAYDIVIDAIGESDAARPALIAAAAFCAAQSKPVLNDPLRVRATARVELATALRDVPGCAAADARRVSREELVRLPIVRPSLVRPADTHGGRGLERVADATDLASYAARFDAENYDVAPFVDYRGGDGYYRKYRIMYVAGEPFPYHLAIEDAWMIHYHRSPMADNAWMREEELRFLTGPASAFPGWDGTVRAIAAAIGLDYFGIDCTLLPDGTLFVFEADTAMLVHDFDPEPGKRAAHGRIAAALDALLTQRAG